MSQHMENRHHKGSDPAGHDHETDLTNRRKSQHAFNIYLGQGDQSRKERGHTPYYGYDGHSRSEKG